MTYRQIHVWVRVMLIDEIIFMSRSFRTGGIVQRNRTELGEKNPPVKAQLSRLIAYASTWESILFAMNNTLVRPLKLLARATPIIDN